MGLCCCSFREVRIEDYNKEFFSSDLGNLRKNGFSFIKLIPSLYASICELYFDF